MTEIEIKLSYSSEPKGLIGRTQKIDKNKSYVFTCADPGSFEVEFVNGSPSKDNSTKFNTQSPRFVSTHKDGHFKFPFQCTFISHDGTKVTVGAPGDPAGGGELEIGN